MRFVRLRWLRYGRQDNSLLSRTGAVARAWGPFGVAAFAFSRSAASLARNLAIRPINFTGTGSESEKRIVPFSTSYNASSPWNAATTYLVAA